jgi:hypothetical protein
MDIEKVGLIAMQEAAQMSATHSPPVYLLEVSDVSYRFGYMVITQPGSNKEPSGERARWIA